MKAINKPHDKFFKQSLSNITIARDFLETHIPAKILSKFNLDVAHNLGISVPTLYRWIPASESLI